MMYHNAILAVAVYVDYPRVGNPLEHHWEHAHANSCRMVGNNEPTAVNEAFGITS